MHLVVVYEIFAVKLRLKPANAIRLIGLDIA